MNERKKSPRNLVRSEAGKLEKLDATTSAARDVMATEAEARRLKTERLRAARLAREAEKPPRE